jgi:C1A family cysteine protease
MFGFSRLTRLAALALLLGPALAQLPASSSRLTAPSWASLFNDLAAQDISAAMGTPLSDIALPDPAKLAARVRGLHSSPRKLSSDELQSQSAGLVTYLQTQFPQLDLAQFQAWAEPIYQAYVDRLGLGSAQHFAGKHKQHRTLILGLRAAWVLAFSTPQMTLALNDMSAMDPLETQWFTGLIKPAAVEENLVAAKKHTHAPSSHSPSTRSPVTLEPTSTRSPTRKSKHKTTPPTHVTIQFPPTTKHGPLFGLPVGTPPDSYDLRTLGVVPAIRDQSQCGSCWAHTTAGTLEIQNAMNGADMYDLSEQMLTSCDNVDAGCNGGWPPDALTWLSGKGGLVSEAAYPYVFTQTSAPACNTNVVNSAPRFVTSDGNTVFLKTEDQIKAAIYTVGPVTVTAYAGGNCFQLYSSGVMNCACSGATDHVILLIGWTPTYWIARNSWGTSWGINGYANIQRGVAGLGQCSIMESPMYASVVTQVGGKVSTAAPTAATGKPTSSTAKPTAATTAKPTSSTAKPTAATTAKPTGSTAKPTGSTAKPTGSTAKPTAATTAKPTTSAPAKGPVTGHPTQSTAKPTAATNAPTTRTPTRLPTPLSTQTPTQATAVPTRYPSKLPTPNPTASSNTCPNNFPIACTGDFCCPVGAGNNQNMCCNNDCACDSGFCPYQNLCCPSDAPLMCSTSLCCPWVLISRLSPPRRAHAVDQRPDTAPTSPRRCAAATAGARAPMGRALTTTGRAARPTRPCTAAPTRAAARTR